MPPVTAERSPPDSRITGADSPVIADSSTDGDALDDVAVAGDELARRARRTRRRPASSVLTTSSMLPSGWRTVATVSARVLRSVSACALPRPSAIASAKLANSTVNHRKAATSPANTSGRVDDLPRSRKNKKW